jgi:hypothetical protein
MADTPPAHVVWDWGSISASLVGEQKLELEAQLPVRRQVGPLHNNIGYHPPMPRRYLFYHSSFPLPSPAPSIVQHLRHPPAIRPPTPPRVRLPSDSAILRRCRSTNLILREQSSAVARAVRSALRGQRPRQIPPSAPLHLGTVLVVGVTDRQAAPGLEPVVDGVGQALPADFVGRGVLRARHHPL